MRTYDQYCAIAMALDAVGDHWTLLIVRELLIQKRCRYTDLRRGPPGTASNLLVDGLRVLEERGIITKDDAPPPIAATLFRLTPRGEPLKPVVAALGKWGAPLLRDEPEHAPFLTHWWVLPLERYLIDHAPDQPPVTVEIRTGDQPLYVEAVDGTVPADIDAAAGADAPAPAGLSAGERRAYQHLVFSYKQVAYAKLMGTRPQTLYGIADSPVGLAAWLLDHGDGCGASTAPERRHPEAAANRTQNGHRSEQ